jgi:hypothetical protein
MTKSLHNSSRETLSEYLVNGIIFTCCIFHNMILEGKKDARGHHFKVTRCFAIAKRLDI